MGERGKVSISRDGGLKLAGTAMGGGCVPCFCQAAHVRRIHVPADLRQRRPTQWHGGAPDGLKRQVDAFFCAVLLELRDAPAAAAARASTWADAAKELGIARQHCQAAWAQRPMGQANPVACNASCPPTLHAPRGRLTAAARWAAGPAPIQWPAAGRAASPPSACSPAAVVGGA